MKVKKTIAFVSVLLMAWITNCQTISDSADSTNKDASASGVVSMGPFVLENSCRCAGHSDLNSLHSMLAIEIKLRLIRLRQSYAWRINKNMMPNGKGTIGNVVIQSREQSRQFNVNFMN